MSSSRPNHPFFRSSHDLNEAVNCPLSDILTLRWPVALTLSSLHCLKPTHRLSLFNFIWPDLSSTLKYPDIGLKSHWRIWHSATCYSHADVVSLYNVVYMKASAHLVPRLPPIVLRRTGNWILDMKKQQNEEERAQSFHNHRGSSKSQRGNPPSTATCPGYDDYVLI